MPHPLAHLNAPSNMEPEQSERPKPTIQDSYNDMEGVAPDGGGIFFKPEYLFKETILAWRTYKEVRAWYKDEHLTDTRLPGLLEQPESYQHCLYNILGLTRAQGTKNELDFRGDFPMSYAFPIFPDTADYQRLLEDPDIARRFGRLLQAQYFNMREAFEINGYFLTYSRRSMFYIFLWWFREAYCDPQLSALDIKVSDERVRNAVNVMIEALEDPKKNAKGCLLTFRGRPLLLEPEELDPPNPFYQGMANLGKFVKANWQRKRGPNGGVTGEWPLIFPKGYVELRHQDLP